MLAWGDETLGQSWDLKLSTDTLRETMGELVDRTPPADTAVICVVGDFFHCDNERGRTEKSGHVLDVDGRWAKVTRTGFALMCECVEQSLRKHKRVVILVDCGNHDEKLAHVLRIYLEGYYRNDERVWVDPSPAAYHYFRWGVNLIGTHHGDKAKPQELPGIMASDRRGDWGEIKFGHWITGHRHAQNAWDLNGAYVEGFRPLHAGDAYSNSLGYRTPTSLVAIHKHKQDGEIGRSQVNIPRLQYM